MADRALCLFDGSIWTLLRFFGFPGMDYFVRILVYAGEQCIFKCFSYISGGDLSDSERATAAGSAYSLSRLMSGLMPFLLLPILKQYGSTVMFTVVALAMALIMLDIALLGPRTTGRSLEEVNEQKLNAGQAVSNVNL